MFRLLSISATLSLSLALGGFALAAPKTVNYRGGKALGYALRVPLRHVKRGRVSARGLPAVVLNGRLALDRIFGGKKVDTFGQRVRAAADQPVGSIMRRLDAPTVPAMKKVVATRYTTRPSKEAKVSDQVTALVSQLQRAQGSGERRQLLASQTKPSFDRNALGRLLRVHRGGKGDQIVFATDAFKSQLRSGGGMLVASGGSDVYLAMQQPKKLVKTGRLAFVILGGQPRTANMGPTAGSKIYFELDRRGRVVDVEVHGRGDLLVKHLSSQLAADIKGNTRKGSKVDPRDLMALINYVSPKLLSTMIDQPKPAQLLGSPQPGAVPFATAASIEAAHQRARQGRRR